MKFSNKAADKRLSKLAASKPSAVFISKPRREQRHAERRVMFKPASLIFGNAKVAHCVINDMSLSGARITIDRNDAFPSDVTLRIDQSAERYDAQIVWRKNMQYGLHFAIETPPIATR